MAPSPGRSWHRLREVLRDEGLRGVARRLGLSGHRASKPDGPQPVFLGLDEPDIAAGPAPVIADRVLFNGWAVSVAGIDRVEVHVGETVHRAAYGGQRLDVARSFPETPDAAASGFILPLDTSELPAGPQPARIVAIAKDGATASREGRVVVDHAGLAYRRWREAWPDGIPDFVTRPVAGAALPPVDVLLWPAGDAEARAPTIASVLGQDHAALRLLLPAGVEPAGSGDQRLVGTDADSLEALACLAEAPFVAVVAPGDALETQALAVLLTAIEGTDAVLAYGDEERAGAGGEPEPFFKPGWSPDLLLAGNYVGRPWILRREAWPDTSLDATAPEHDLMLRLATARVSAAGVPAVLARRGGHREPPERAVAAALERERTPATPTPGPGGWCRPNIRLPRGPKVSIIIPTRAGSPVIRDCLERIAAHTDYAEREIVLLDNASEADPTARAFLDHYPARRITPEGPFNWSGFNNLGASAADGDVLAFLNDDIAPVNADWLAHMVAHALRPGVGPVGAKLRYGDNRLQHAGIFLMPEAGGSRHAFRYLRADEAGANGLAQAVRNVSAVTGACLVIRREAFEEIGRFDEQLALTNNDIDFCLRAWDQGWRVVWTPDADLYHYERTTRADLSESADIARYFARWSRLYEDGDRFYNRNLSLAHDDYRIAEPTGD